MKQLRIPFPDYSEEQQEQDVQRHVAAVNKMYNRELYVMRVNGDWGAVMPKRRHNVIFTADAGVDLVEFVSEVKRDLEKFNIKPHFHCVRNFGIESEIAKSQNKKIIDSIFKEDKRRS